MGIRHALAVAGFAVRIGGLVLPALAQTLDDAKTVPDQSMAGGDQKSGDMRGGSVAGLIAVPGLRAAVSGLLSLLGLAVLAGSAHAAASDWASNAHGSARLISAVEATGSGTRLDVGLQLRLTPGWHTYWRTPGDAGVAPTIDWQGSENLAGATVAWPAPLHLPPAGGLETIGYENGVVLPISVTLERAGAPLRLHAEVDYASCKDVCIPYHASLDLGPEGPSVRKRTVRNVNTDKFPAILVGGVWI